MKKRLLYFVILLTLLLMIITKTYVSRNSKNITFSCDEFAWCIKNEMFNNTSYLIPVPYGVEISSFNISVSIYILDYPRGNGIAGIISLPGVKNYNWFDIGITNTGKMRIEISTKNGRIIQWYSDTLSKGKWYEINILYDERDGVDVFINKNHTKKIYTSGKFKISQDFITVGKHDEYFRGYITNLTISMTPE